MDLLDRAEAILAADRAQDFREYAQLCLREDDGQVDDQDALYLHAMVRALGITREQHESHLKHIKEFRGHLDVVSFSQSAANAAAYHRQRATLAKRHVEAEIARLDKQLREIQLDDGLAADFENLIKTSVQKLRRIDDLKFSSDPNTVMLGEILEGLRSVHIPASDVNVVLPKGQYGRLIPTAAEMDTLKIMDSRIAGVSKLYNATIALATPPPEIDPRKFLLDPAHLEQSEKMIKAAFDENAAARLRPGRTWVQGKGFEPSNPVLSDPVAGEIDPETGMLVEAAGQSAAATTAPVDKDQAIDDEHDGESPKDGPPPDNAGGLLHGTANEPSTTNKHSRRRVR